MKEAKRYTGKQDTAIALGFFDGLHIGHQAVIAAALKYAHAQRLDTAVFTFSSTMGTGVRQGKSATKRLCSSAQKRQLLQTMGVGWCFEPAFESFCSLTPEQFFEELLCNTYCAKMIACGENFRFGNRRSGDVETLRRLCKQHSVHLEVIPTTLWNGEPVSSTRIRTALAAGEVSAARAMLARPFEVMLPVERGRGLGSALGFPTLNQHFPEWMQAPKSGVYITKTVLNGAEWPSATGYGSRPTVNGKHSTCETFVPGFEGVLYGHEVAVQFFERIADTTCFDTPQQLALAVQGWAEQAVDYFHSR